MLHSNRIWFYKKMTQKQPGDFPAVSASMSSDSLADQSRVCYHHLICQRSATES